VACFSNRVICFFVDNFPSWNVIIIGGLIGLFWSYGCLWFSGFLKINKELETGYTRKIFHFLIFISAAVIEWIWGTSVVCLFGGSVSLVILYALVKGSGDLLYEGIAREKDEPRRSFYIIVPYFATLIGGLLSNIFFGSNAIIGYLVTGFGDAIGEPVGTRFGRHKYKVLSFGGVKAFRTIEGSAAVFIVCIFAASAGIALLPNSVFNLKTLTFIPVLSLVCMLTEALSPHGWDNATMQFVPSYFVSSFFLY